MSYHGHKNIEQSIHAEGQGQPLEGNFSKGASYATPSEAAFNDVYSALRGSSRMSGGAKSELKQLGPIGIGEEIHKGFSGGNEGQLKRFFEGGNGVELKQLEPNGGGKYCPEQLGAAAESGAHAGGSLANKIEFAKKAEEAGMELNKKHGIGYGESFAQKAERKEDWDNITNNLKLGLGMALGPVGVPLVFDALRHDMNTSKSAMGESSSSIMHREMMQRGKMLKSWKSSDE